MVILTLGLAIGVNSTIFSVVNGVLLRPLELMLLVSAGLSIRSFVRLTSVDLGCKTSAIVATHVVLPRARDQPPAAKRQFIADLVERVGQLPGAQFAVWSTSDQNRTRQCPPAV